MTSSIGSPRTTFSDGSEYIRKAEVGTPYQMFRKEALGRKIANDMIGEMTSTTSVLSDVSSYSHSLSSKIRGDLMKRVAISAKKLGADVDMSNSESVIESLSEYLPDPDVNGKVIRGDTKKINQISKAIAKVVNDSFSVNKRFDVIDVEQNKKELIRDVATYLYGMSSGINKEINDIHTLLTKNISSLSMLIDISSKYYADDKNSAYKYVYKHLSSHDRQVVLVLNDLLTKLKNVNGIIDVDIAKINEVYSNHRVKFENLTTTYDANDNDLLGEQLARLLSTFNNVAQLVYMTDKTLRKVGLIVSQFKYLNEVEELLDNTLSRLKVVETKVVEVQKEEKIPEKVEITGGGYFSDSDSEGGDSLIIAEEREDVYLQGGANNLPSRTPEELRIEARKKRAELALKSYVREVNKYINNFVDNVDRSATLLGSTMYDTHKLEELVKQINVVDALREPQMYLALAGYSMDDTHKIHARKYKDDMLRIIKTFKELGTKLPAARKPLDDAAKDIDTILKKVDVFSDVLSTLLKNLPRTEMCDIVSDIPVTVSSVKGALAKLNHSLHVSQMRRMIKKCATGINRYSENYPELLAYAVGERRQELNDQRLEITCPLKVDGELPFTNKDVTSDNINDKNVNYLYAHIRDCSKGNDSIWSRSIGNYYFNAKLIQGPVLVGQQLPAGYAKNLFDALANDPNTNPNALQTAIHNKLNEEDFKKNYLYPFGQEIDDEFKAKQRLYKALESLDLILSTFTRELANDVDLIKEVKRYLDDTKVYTKWFTDYTGDLLTSVFESMPSHIANEASDGLDVRTNVLRFNGAVMLTGQTDGKFDPTLGYSLGTPTYSGLADSLRNSGGSSYYYKSLLDKINQSQYILAYGKASGVVAGKEEIKAARKSINDFYDNFQALKNLFHAFITIYNKIVGSNRKIQSVMSPSQIYYSILSYLKQSALARKSDGQGIPQSSNWNTRVTGLILPAYYPKMGGGAKFSGYGDDGLGWMGATGTVEGGGSILNYEDYFNKFKAVYSGDKEPTGYNLRGYLVVYGTVSNPEYIYKIYSDVDNIDFSSVTSGKVADKSLYLEQVSSGTIIDFASNRALISPPTFRGYFFGILNNDNIIDSREYSDKYRIAPIYNDWANDKPYTVPVTVKSSTSPKISSILRKPVRTFTSLPATPAPPAPPPPPPTPTPVTDGNYGTYRRMPEQYFQSVYELEDRLCAMGIKSIVSSVLSCMGLYYVTQQPVNMGVMYTTRSIMGGGVNIGDDYSGELALATDVPNISDGAFESYYYIIRLAEFYRLLFSDSENPSGVSDIAGEKTCRIRYPLDMGGDFGKVMFIVIQTNGIYNDSEIKIMINEINKAYYKYKSTDGVIEAFIREVNSKYSCFVDEEAQTKLYQINYRLGEVCPGKGNIEDIINQQFHRGVTGSLDFDDEDPSYRKNDALDSLITPSDAFGDNIGKYVEACGDDELFNVTDERYKYNGKARADAKYKLDGAMKLYAKLSHLRNRLDCMFDNYLKRDSKELVGGINPYRQSTDVYNQTYYSTFVGNQKAKFKRDAKTNLDKYKSVYDLINNREKKLDRELDTNSETMVVFNETAMVMHDSVGKTRILLDALVKDIAIWNGNVFYEEFQTKDLKTLAKDSVEGKLLGFAYDTWLETIANEGESTNVTGAETAYPSGKDQPKYGWFNGKINNVDYTKNAGFTGHDKDVVLATLFGDNDDDKAGSGIYDINKIYRLYSAIFKTIITKLSGLKLLGLGYDYTINNGQRDGGNSVIKDGILASFLCPPQLVPHVIAYNRIKVGSHNYRDQLGKKNLRAKFISIVYEEVIRRFELSHLFATMIGNCSRLSAAMGNLVNVTVSSQGTYLDIAGLQNLLVDSSSYVKQYVQQFYDYIPPDLRKSLLSKTDAGSIYQNDKAISDIFQSHISNEVLYAPLIDSTNNTLTVLHQTMISDQDYLHSDDSLFHKLKIHRTDDIAKFQTGSTVSLPISAEIVGYSYGGNAIVNSLVPSHCVPTQLSIKGVPDAGVNNLFKLVLTKSSLGGSAPSAGFGFPLFTNAANINDYIVVEDFSSCNHISALLPALNYGVKTMIRSLFDYGTQKIYQGVVSKFMSTKLAMNIERPDTAYPDIFKKPSDIDDTFTHVNYAMPARNALLTTSNALIIREMFQAINPKTQSPLFLLSALSDIRDTGLIDTFRLKLPMFREYFLRLINKCKMLRAFMTKGCGTRQNKRRLVKVVCPWGRLIGGDVVATSAIKPPDLNVSGATATGVELTLEDKLNLLGAQVSRSNALGGIGGTKFNLEPILGSDGIMSDSRFYGMSNEDLYGYFMETITSIEDVSYELASVCESIHKEYVVDDKFMVAELPYERNRRTPDSYVPLSLLTVFTSPSKSFNELHSLETVRGSAPFKVQFGAKGILYSDSNKVFSDKYLAGPISVIKDANAGSRVHLDVSKYMSFSKRLIELVRFNFSLLDYSEVSVVADNFNFAMGGNIRFSDRGGMEHSSIGGSHPVQLSQDDFMTAIPGGDPFAIRGGAPGPTTEQAALHLLANFNHYPVVDSFLPSDVKLNPNNFSNQFDDPSYKNILNRTYGDEGTCYKDISRHLGRYEPEKEPYTGKWILNWFKAFLKYNNSGSGSGGTVLTKDKIDDYLKEVGKKTPTDPLAKADYNYKVLAYNKLLKECKNFDCSQTKRKLVDAIIFNLNAKSSGTKVISFVDFVNGGTYTQNTDLIASPKPTDILDNSILIKFSNKVSGLTSITSSLPETPLSGSNSSGNKLVCVLLQNLIIELQGVGGASLPTAPSAPVSEEVIAKLLLQRDVLLNAKLLKDGTDDVSKYYKAVALGGTVTGYTPLDYNKLIASYNFGTDELCRTTTDKDIVEQANYSPYYDRENTGPDKFKRNNYPTTNTLNDVAKLYGGLPFAGIYGGATNAEHRYSLLKLLQDKASGLNLYTDKQTFTIDQVLELIDGDNGSELKSVIIGDLHKSIAQYPQCSRGISYIEDDEHTKNLIAMIVELNINPINVHSLQRFIPFANIYNYSYTLDRFVYTTYNVHEQWGSLTKNGNKQEIRGDLLTSTTNRYYPEDATESTKLAFIKLIMDPYAQVDPRAYGTPAVVGNNTILRAPIGQILRGYDHLGMGAPKFLADQVLGKALLGSVYIGGASSEGGVGNIYDNYGVRPITALQNASTLLTGGAAADYSYNTYGPTRDDLSRPSALGNPNTWAPNITGLVNDRTNPGDLNLLRYISFFDKETHQVKTYDILQAVESRLGTGNQKEQFEFLREFHNEGYERFNTQLIRNVLLISNLQRFMRYTINSWLTRACNLVESGHKAVTPEITEFKYGAERLRGPLPSYGGEIAQWL